MSIVLSLYNTKAVWPPLSEEGAKLGEIKHRQVSNTAFWRLSAHQAECIRLVAGNLADSFSISPGEREYKWNPVPHDVDLERHILTSEHSEEEQKHNVHSRTFLNCFPSFAPGRSARYESGRKKFGAFGSFLQEEDLKATNGMSYFQLNSYVRSLCSRSFRQSYKVMDLSPSTIRRFLSKQLRVGEEQVFREISERNACRVAHVFDPAKVRLVQVYRRDFVYPLRPLQKQLLAAWKKDPCCTMKDEDLLCRVQKLVGLARRRGYELLNSVDYESATDLLNRDCALTFLETLKGHPLYQAALESFGPSKTEYKYADERGSNATIAVGTQPMGHPLSFPILCSVNKSVLTDACTTWWIESVDPFWSTIFYYQCPDGRLIGLNKQESSQRSIYILGYDFSHLGNNSALARDQFVKETVNHALINGDDLLYSAPCGVIDRFHSIASSYGLYPSAGKNIVSRRYCSINSQTYRFDIGLGLCSRVHYGMIKAVLGPDRENAIEVVSTLNKFLPSLPEFWYLTSFLRHIDDRNFGIPGFRRNWIIPVHLGGLGLSQEVEGVSFRITRPQRLVMAHFVNKEQRKLTVKYSIRKKDILYEDRNLMRLALRMIQDFPARLELEIPSGEVKAGEAEMEVEGSTLPPFVNHLIAWILPFRGVKDIHWTKIQRNHGLKPVSCGKARRLALSRWYVHNSAGIPIIPLPVHLPTGSQAIIAQSEKTRPKQNGKRLHGAPPEHFECKESAWDEQSVVYLARKSDREVFKTPHLTREEHSLDVSSENVEERIQKSKIREGGAAPNPARNETRQ
jgi:hypothetical protein